MRMRLRVEPHALLEAHAVHHRRVALPVSDRMPVPPRVQLLECSRPSRWISWKPGRPSSEIITRYDDDCTN
jgi:hypothetical protein